MKSGPGRGDARGVILAAEGFALAGGTEILQGTDIRVAGDGDFMDVAWKRAFDAGVFVGPPPPSVPLADVVLTVT